MVQKLCLFTYTHFPKRLAEILWETIVEYGIGNAQISVGENMTENLYANSQTCSLIKLKRFQDQNNL